MTTPIKEKIPGFGLRVTANGAKSFVLNYSIAGRERRYTIGRFPAWSALAARKKAHKLRVKIDDGIDPLEEKDAAFDEPFMDDLAKDYTDWAKTEKSEKSQYEDQLMLKRIVLPKLGRHRVSAVSERDIRALKASLSETPVQANRVLALLSKMFSMAVDSKMRDDNPVRKIKRYHENPKENWLSLEQLQALALALDNYPEQDAADALRLLVLTGARPDEVLSAEWPQFDLGRGIWTKLSHHTKERKLEHVQLSRAALLILNRMAEHKAGVHLFPGRDPGTARTTLRNAWKQVCKAAGLATEYHIKGKRGKPLPRWKPNFRVYDLRHSFASHLVSRGKDLYAVGKLMGHTQPGTTQKYSHLFDAAQREVANTFPDVLGPRKLAG